MNYEHCKYYEVKIVLDTLDFVCIQNDADCLLQTGQMPVEGCGFTPDEEHKCPHCGEYVIDGFYVAGVGMFCSRDHAELGIL